MIMRCLTQRISGFTVSRFLCSHLVGNEDVLTLREIYLSLEPNSESDAGKNLVISKTPVFRLAEERKVIQNEVK